MPLKQFFISSSMAKSVNVRCLVENYIVLYFCIVSHIHSPILYQVGETHTSPPTPYERSVCGGGLISISVVTSFTRNKTTDPAHNNKNYRLIDSNASRKGNIHKHQKCTLPFTAREKEKKNAILANCYNIP